MNYITIEAKNYEEAVKKARQQYGEKLRIHSRRDVIGKGFLGKSHVRSCELTCFLTSDETSEEKPDKIKNEEDQLIQRFEEEAKTPDPGSLANRKPVTVDKEKILNRTDEILRLNDFSYSTSSAYKRDMNSWADCLDHEPSDDEIQLKLASVIADSVAIDHQNQKKMPKLSVFVGLPACGKTSTILKIAGLYIKSSLKAAVIGINNPENSFSQLKKAGIKMNMPVASVNNSEELTSQLALLENTDVTFIETNGISFADSDEIQKQFSILRKLRVSYKVSMFAVISATSKYCDINSFLKMFDEFGLSGLIITKIDETTTIGNVISAARDRNLPLVFSCAGKKIPKDLSKTTVSSLTEMLKGFSVDLKKV